MTWWRRKTDQPDDVGTFDKKTPEEKAESFGKQYGRSTARAADKQRRGVPPYTHEETSRKHRWGRRKS